MGRHYTDEEKKMILDKVLSDKELAEKFGVTVSGIATLRHYWLHSEANKDKRAEQRRQYRKANRDKLIEYSRQYRKVNRDKLVEYSRQHYKANKDKIAESKRQYREANKDKIAESMRQYSKANKNKIAEYQRLYRNRNWRDSGDRPWTIYEDILILEYSMPVPELAEKLGRSLAAVLKRRSRLKKALSEGSLTEFSLDKQIDQQLTDKQRKMVEDNHNLIYQFLSEKQLPEDEYYGAVAEALCKASMTYVGVNTLFSTYAFKIMEMEIYNELYIRDYNMEATISLDADLGDDSSTLSDTIPSKIDIEYEVCSRETLQNILSLCTERERKILY